MILDSNIVIYAVQPNYEKLRNYLREHEYELTVSIITKLEVLGYNKLTETEKEMFERFFEVVKQIPISQAVIDKSIELRQERKMSIGDSIIAATTLLENDVLLTNNEDDFKEITNLRVIAMKEIME